MRRREYCALCPDFKLLSEEFTKRDTNESHDPVQRLNPSLLTPRQLTRLSCPARIPTLSPFKTSQTYCQIWTMRGNTLQLKSSYPAKRSRPEAENAMDVIPQRMLSD